MATLRHFRELYPQFSEQNKVYHEIWGTLHLIAAIVGTIGCSIVIYTCLRRKVRNETLLFLNVMWADLLYCLGSTVFGSYQFATGKFLFEETGCVIEGTMVIMSCCLSMLTLSAIAIERYLIVVHGFNLSNNQMRTMMITILVVSVLISFWPIYTWSFPDSIGIYPTLILCTLSSWDKHPMTIAQLSLAFTIILGTSNILTFCYLQIYLKYHNTVRSLNEGLKEVEEPSIRTVSGQIQSTETSKIHSRRDKLERKVLIKCVTITAVFLICWVPYVFRLIYEIATEDVVSGHLDGFLCFICLFNSMLNPFLLYFFDGAIKSAVHELLGIKSIRTSEYGRSSQSHDLSRS
ncbi:hypothetical protein EDD86DRAFT_276066 [Gorgonomyces haynaldii]|nr:hypothetical protein EDD86DRAFT_276066 [Gorgonomyces haynaldii]